MRTWAICLRDGDHPASLERSKLYEVVADADAERFGFLRIVDESSEDYLLLDRPFISSICPAR